MTVEEIRELQARVAKRIRENDKKLRRLENIQNILGPAVDRISERLSNPSQKKGASCPR